MRIGSFAAKSGLSPDTIRYYERIGLMPHPPRDASGRRSYGSAELAWASFLCKLQVMDMSIRDRLAYGRLRAEGDSTVQARLEILQTHRTALVARQAEIGSCIAILEAKIDHYTRLGGGAEGSNDGRGSTRDDGGCGDGRHRGPG